MQDWAVELQRFFTSGTSDAQAIARAARACDDPEVGLYLRKLPPGDDQSFALGKRIVQRLANQGLFLEATILQLVVFLPTIAIAENASRFPIEHRREFLEFLRGLTNSCRNHPDTVPSLAMMCNLSGRFLQATREFAAARGAFEEARDIYARLAGADPQTHESALAMTLNSLGILYRDTREFAAARGAFEEARDIYARLPPPSIRPRPRFSRSWASFFRRVPRVDDPALNQPEGWYLGTSTHSGITHSSPDRFKNGPF